MPVAGSTEDTLITPPGYTATVLLRWGDPLVAGVPEFDPTTQTAAKQAQQFGYNCDFIGYLPLPQGSHSSTRGLLGVNHEFTLPMLMHPGWDGQPESVTQEMVDINMAAHGFSVVEIVRGSRGTWTSVGIGLQPAPHRGHPHGHSGACRWPPTHAHLRRSSWLDGPGHAQ